MLCASCEARHRGICGALNAEQLQALAKSTKRHRAEAGKELVGDSRSVERFSNVLSGVVKLTKTLSDGRQQIVGLQFAPRSISPVPGCRPSRSCCSTSPTSMMRRKRVLERLLAPFSDRIVVVSTHRAPPLRGARTMELP
ncbi:cyclic nucleotide-binding domain-containing protein [Mesorhizobium sp. B3-1-6]|nr:cyclic nucleotide-binding domain-containing protein [Mesorhizobium sp. B3-1-6]